MKRPFDSVRELFFENISKYKENAKFIFEHSDKLMVWIMGFSIGGLSLIVSNISSLDQIIPHCILKYILVLLTVSIISGIFFRISFYIYRMFYLKAEKFLEESFSNREFMEIEPGDLSNESDIKEIIRRIKDDFGEDFFYLFEFYEKADANKKPLFIADLKRHYSKVGEWAKKDYENALLFAKDNYQEAFGLSDKQSNKIFQQSISSSYLRIFHRTSNICFAISCLTFVSVIIILCINY